MTTTVQLLTRMRAIAESRGHILYDIMFRNAGVGVLIVDLNKIPQEIEPSVKDVLSGRYSSQDLAMRRAKKRQDHENAKVVYLYKPTLRKSLSTTIEHLKKLPITHRAP